MKNTLFPKFTKVEFTLLILFCRIFKNLFVVSLFMYLSSAAVAQDYSEKKNKDSEIYSANELKRFAKNEVKFGNYSNAVLYLEQLIKLKPTQYLNYYKLGECYLKINNYEKAGKLFSTCFDKSNQQYFHALFMSAEMHKICGNCAKAKTEFQKFNKEAPSTKKNELLKKQVKIKIFGCDSIQEKIKKQERIFIHHLDSTINRLNIEQSPFYLDSSTFIYNAARLDKEKISLPMDSASINYRHLFGAKFDTQNWKFDTQYFTELELNGLLLANAFFNPQTNRLYLTFYKENFWDKKISSLYVSEKNSKGEFSIPIILDKNINSKDYNSTQPSAYLDTQKGIEYVYFSSNRKNGKGGYDIWYFTYNTKSKKYSTAKNLSKINSDEDDVTPQYNLSNKYLTFSSKGFAGAGGYDVFKAYGEKQKFNKPTNVIYINSSFDDLGYVESPKGGSGLFTSNRNGSVASADNANCCDDLYWFEMNKSLERTVEVETYSVENKDRKKLEYGTIKLQIKNAIDGNTTIKEFQISGANSNLIKFIPENQYTYQVYVEAENHISKTINLLESDLQKTFSRFEVDLLKYSVTPIVIPNIVYETNKFDLSENSKKNIDTTIYKYLIENPSLKFEIRSHTDNVGSDNSNMTLSQKRAQGVVNYLVNKGIESSRLKSNGFGETLPIETNDTPEGRQKNRRTDFLIIGKVEAKESKEE